MRILIIGGTGNLSSACATAALDAEFEVYCLTRGSRPDQTAPGAVSLTADIRDGDAARAALGDLRFGAVVDFFSYTPEQLAKNLSLLGERTAQYCFISTASAYRKPPVHHLVTEGTPLVNPFWAYARAKIACGRLLESAGGQGLPYTIIRPSHTYGRPDPIWSRIHEP